MERTVRLGLLALPLSAWSVTLALPWRGELVLPGEAGWEAWVASSGFQVWAATAMNATVWLAFGLVALHRAMVGMPARPRFYGTAFAFAGTLVWLPILGVLNIAWPAVGPDAAAAMLAERTTLVCVAFASLTSAVGFILLAWGAWAADRTTAILLAVGALAYVPMGSVAAILTTAALAIAFTRVALAAWST